MDSYLSASDVTEHLPVSEPVFLILLSIVDGARHGYGILLEVERRTDGEVTLGTGTLYSAIKRLREDGLIREAPRPAEESDPRRKFYELLPAGHAVVEAEARRHERLASLARAKNVLPAFAAPTKQG